jgi:conjugative transfer signal peptidase TraF
VTVARELIAVLTASTLMLTSTSKTPCLIWNATASAPVGLYTLADERKPHRGDLVLAALPLTTQTFAAQRNYLPMGVPLVKHVAALAGDRICADTKSLSINGRIAALRLRFDSAGRSLPAWSGCHILAATEVLLLNPAVSHSFDGRYFGPVSVTSILGKLGPLWTR